MCLRPSLPSPILALDVSNKALDSSVVVVIELHGKVAATVPNRDNELALSNSSHHSISHALLLDMMNQDRRYVTIARSIQDCLYCFDDDHLDNDCFLVSDRDDDTESEYDDSLEFDNDEDDNDWLDSCSNDDAKDCDSAVLPTCEATNATFQSVRLLL
jgi:hypothetical protein